MENPKELLQLDFGFESEPLINQKKQFKSYKKAKADFVFDFMDCLRSPVIVFKSAWQDAIPSDLLKKITMARMMCLMTGEPMASLTEVVVYMMPRTFEAPMCTEWVNIYAWCGLQYVNVFNNADQRKEMAAAMGKIAPEKLSDYETHLLSDLRKWIYDKRRKALKQSMKAENHPKSTEVVTNQKHLFDD